MNERSYQRVRHLLGTEIAEKPDVIEELDKYGLGTARSLQDYEEYSGLSFRERSIRIEVQEARFHPAGQKAVPAQAPAVQKSAAKKASR